jgi:thymidine phosphorylase
MIVRLSNEVAVAFAAVGQCVGNLTERLLGTEGGAADKVSASTVVNVSMFPVLLS